MLFHTSALNARYGATRKEFKRGTAPYALKLPRSTLSAVQCSETALITLMSHKTQTGAGGGATYFRAMKYLRGGGGCGRKDEFSSVLTPPHSQ